jgi:malonate decarboxylase epsilon subunit
MSVAFLFPCQGSQHSGMLSQLPESSVKDHYLNRASEFIGYDAYMLESEDALATTEATQMALFICGVIGAQSLRKAGVRPSFVAGHSVGAFAAAVVAGSLPFETGLQIVAYRGCLMHAAFPSGYGMGVIVGLTETAVAKLLEEISADYPEVYLAIVNARNQIVVTGPVEDVDAVLQFALERCARRTQRLPVGVPSHCRLLQGVVEKLRRSFKSIRLKEPEIPYAANRNGRILRRGAAIWADLIENVGHPVRWYDATTALIEAGVSLFIEMPPGRTLTGICSTSFPEVPCVAFNDSDLHRINHASKNGARVVASHEYAAQ